MKVISNNYNSVCPTFKGAVLVHFLNNKCAEKCRVAKGTVLLEKVLPASKLSLVELPEKNSVLVVEGKERQMLLPFLVSQQNALKDYYRTDFFSNAIYTVKQEIKNSGIVSNKKELSQLNAYKKAGYDRFLDNINKKPIVVDVEHESVSRKMTVLEQKIVTAYKKLTDNARDVIDKSTEDLYQLADNIIGDTATRKIIIG